MTLRLQRIIERAHVRRDHGVLDLGDPRGVQLLGHLLRHGQDGAHVSDGHLGDAHNPARLLVDPAVRLAGPIAAAQLAVVDEIATRAALLIPAA